MSAGRRRTRRRPAAARGRRPRLGRGDAALLAGGAALTALLAAAATRAPPPPPCSSLARVALAALLLLGRKRIARTRVGAVLTALLVSLPLLALLGPSFALPAAPQAFLFRIVLAVVLYAGVCFLLVRRDPMPFAAKDLALPAVLWFAWLLLGLVWAPDKLAAFNYIAIVVTMAAVFAATAAAGGTRRRLIWFGYTMLVGYAFVVGFTILEARLGIRLPTSRLLTAVTSQTYAVTSVFHNQNDLATYIVLCWPFMLCAFFFTRRLRWLLLTLLFMAMGAAAFVRTGSRSSLVAAGISSLAAVVLFWHLGPKLSSRTGKVMMGWSSWASRRRRLAALQQQLQRHAAPVPPGGAAQPGGGQQGLRGDPHQPDGARPADRRRHLLLAPGRGRPRASSARAPTPSASATCTTGGSRPMPTAASSASPCIWCSSSCWCSRSGPSPGTTPNR